MINKYKLFILFLVMGNLILNSQINKLKANVSNLEGEIGIEYLKRKKDDFYILGPGDSLSIRFVEPFSIDINSGNARDLENKLFGINDFEVDGDGYLLLPRISKVYVEGLTISELKILLDKSYAEFIKRPMVEISISKYRPINVYIEGEVLNPGLYTLPGRGAFISQSKDNKIFFRGQNIDLENIQPDVKPNLAVFPKIYNLIKLSGGITLYSDISNIKIIRNNPISKGGGKIEANINFLDAIENDDKSQNIRLLDGDRIIVQKSEIELEEQLSKALKSNINSKFIDVAILGRVENGGRISINRSSTLNEAIDLVGGIKVLRGPVQLTRYNSDGKIEKRKFGFSPNAKRGSYKNPYLKTGDVIIVGKGPLIKTNEVIGEVTSPFLGIYTTFSILDDILN